MSRRSSIVTGRRPHARDTERVNYEYDSEAEWEQDEDGQSLYLSVCVCVCHSECVKQTVPHHSAQART